MVHFHHQAMAADRYRCTAEGNYLVAPARRVARVDDDGKMRLLADYRNSGNVEGIPAVVRKCPHPPLAKDYLVVSALHDIFGGHEPFLDRRRHPAFQKDRFAGFSRASEQAEVLHAPGPYLDYVGVFFHKVENFVVDGFRDDGHSCFLADACEDSQPFLAQPLEGVRGGPGLEGAAPEDLRAGTFHDSCDSERLAFTLNRARPRHDCEVAVADPDVADFDHRVPFLGFTTHQLVGTRDWDQLFDPGERGKPGTIHRSTIVQDAYGDSFASGYGAGGVASVLDRRDDGLDFRPCSLLLHYDQHGAFPSLEGLDCKVRTKKSRGARKLFHGPLENTKRTVSLVRPTVPGNSITN